MIVRLYRAQRKRIEEKGSIPITCHNVRLVVGFPRCLENHAMIFPEPGNT